MKTAVIDLGTNTFHLIIASLDTAGIEILYKTNVPVQLGQDRINQGEIIPEAFQRGISTLKMFKEEIDKYQISHITATATAAVRSAANGKAFVRAAAEQAGIVITIITGEQEAAYIFKGVAATGLIRQKSLIMDIGGGSTEFILCSPEGLFWKKSYPLGAAKLLQAYWHSDPISADDQQAIEKLLNEQLTDLTTQCRDYNPTCLIGSAGAFETFTALIYPETDLSRTAAIDLDYPIFFKLIEKLIRSDHASRAAMPGIIPLRVDMIVIASLLCRFILQNIPVTEIALSTYDLKWGLLHQLAAETHVGSKNMPH